MCDYDYLLDEIETDPGLVCPYCKFDNTPLPGEEAPDTCEGCGARLE